MHALCDASYGDSNCLERGQDKDQGKDECFYCDDGCRTMALSETRKL